MLNCYRCLLCGEEWTRESLEENAGGDDDKFHHCGNDEYGVIQFIGMMTVKDVI